MRGALAARKKRRITVESGGKEGKEGKEGGTKGAGGGAGEKERKVSMTMMVEVGPSPRFMEKIEVDHIARRPLDGQLCLYFTSKARLKKAVAWVHSHRSEQLEKHVAEECAHPFCVEARENGFSNGVIHRSDVGRHRVWVTKDTQHLIGMDEAGEELRRQRKKGGEGTDSVGGAKNPLTLDALEVGPTPRMMEELQGEKGREGREMTFSL